MTQNIFLQQSATRTGRLEVPGAQAFLGQRARASDIAGAYKRYALAANGVSPMAIPGTRGGQYTADGLTHTECGIPTSGERDHRAQLDKRRDKLAQFNFGDHWATSEGAGDLAVITWGSLTGTAREAIARNRDFVVGVKARLSRDVAGQNDYEVLRRAQEVASFFNLEWVQPSADCYVCAECGYIHWFLLEA